MDWKPVVHEGESLNPIYFPTCTEHSMGHRAQESDKPEATQYAPNDLKHFVACEIVSTLKSIIDFDTVPKKKKWHLAAKVK